MEKVVVTNRFFRCFLSFVAYFIVLIWPVLFGGFFLAGFYFWFMGIEVD